MLSMAVAPSASAASSELVLDNSDLAFILKQIQIAEAHATEEGGGLGQIVPATSVLGNGPNDVPAANLPYGIRQVDGRNNNLGVGRANAGAADQPFPRLTVPQWRPIYGTGVPAPNPNGSLQNGTGPSGPAGPPPSVLVDNSPRMISNLIADMTPAAAEPGENSNPAAVAASIASGSNGQRVPLSGGFGFGSVEVLNIAPNAGVAPPTNAMFSFFGQFFDHGLDLVGKSGTEFIQFSATEPKDPLNGQGPMFMSRGLSNVQVSAGTNRTTPWIDQNQTYASTPSKQVLIREYQVGVNGPVATGNLLGSTAHQATAITGTQPAEPSVPAIAGNIGSWRDVKEQARNVLGIELRDTDIGSVPLFLTDEYGRYLRGPNNLPQLVTTTVVGGVNAVIEGNLASPVATSGTFPANYPIVALQNQPYTAQSTGHTFLDDIAHFAVPVNGQTGAELLADADTSPGNVPGAGEYDNELLDAHFITGDGRGNENIGLTTIHTVFHAEHNRLVADIASKVNALPAADPTRLGFEAAGWGLGERLFQAARMVNENEYQHLVFETFVRKIEPGIHAFAAYNPSINPDVSVEFSQAVYRLGHSMLNETIPRKNAGTISLFDGFLNPLAFSGTGPNASGANGLIAAANIAEGAATQRSNEIDEFVTGALRNNLVGTPLDLPAINIARGRDLGVPSLNNTRYQLWLQTGNAALFPYDSWNALATAGALRHQESFVNFLAAYAKWPTITAATTVAAKRQAANNLITLSQQLTPAGADAAAFLAGTDNSSALPPFNGKYSRTKDANGVPVLVGGLLDSPTGIDDIDLWMGGLAEGRGQLAGMLGSTFTQIFRDQIERLQDGDRFYYIDRLAGTNMFVEIENNTLADMFVRNTPATGLAADMFSAPAVTVDLNNLVTGAVTGGTVTAPAGANGLVTYNGTSPAVFIGRDTAPNNDQMTSGTGDDTMRGFDGNDTIQGGAGSDNLQGGTGNDVLVDSGSDGADLAVGGSGDDFFDTGLGVGDFNGGGTGADTFSLGQDGGIVDGGAGNDLVQGGVGGATVSGQSGDDWMQGGAGPDGFTGDSALPPLGIDILTPGNDVLIGGLGVDLSDGGGGSDVIGGGDSDLTTFTADSAVGGNGFDWQTYTTGAFTGPAGLKPGQVADLTLVAQAVGDLAQADMDTFPNTDVEGLSGGNGDDTLSGDSFTSFVTPVGGDGTLDAAGIAQVSGLAQLISGGANGTSGNIIIGGPGSDVIEGRGGNDLIDGDAALTVGLTNTCPTGPANASLATLITQIRNGTIGNTCTAGNVTITRAIVAGPQAGTDVAVFSGNSGSYTVTGAAPQFTVAGPDGTDVVRNIETLRFANGDFAPASLVGVVNPPAGGGGGGGAVTPPAAGGSVVHRW
jgi:hypothetical protein